jgi:hypothetical protein
MATRNLICGWVRVRLHQSKTHAIEIEAIPVQQRTNAEPVIILKTELSK